MYLNDLTHKVNSSIHSATLVAFTAVEDVVTRWPGSSTSTVT